MPQQQIETLEEFEELHRVDLSDHEPIVVDIEDSEDELEAFDANH